MRAKSVLSMGNRMCKDPETTGNKVRWRNGVSSAWLSARRLTDRIGGTRSSRYQKPWEDMFILKAMSSHEGCEPRWIFLTTE